MEQGFMLRVGRSFIPCQAQLFRRRIPALSGVNVSWSVWIVWLLFHGEAWHSNPEDPVQGLEVQAIGSGSGQQGHGRKSLLSANHRRTNQAACT